MAEGCPLPHDASVMKYDLDVCALPRTLEAGAVQLTELRQRSNSATYVSFRP